MSEKPDRSTRLENGRRPTRRRLLEWAGSGGLVALSGCTGDVGEELPPNTKWPTAELTPSLPVEGRTDVLADRIETAADADIPDESAFATAVDDYALEVESVDRDQDVLTIEFINTEFYSEGNVHHIGPIAGAFAALVASGYDAVGLGISILDAAPTSFGTAEIDAAWSRAYNDGDLSAAEYGDLVATTIESKRHPPDVGVSPRE